MLIDGIEKMRTVANNLMPNLIESYGLEMAITSFIDSIRKTGQLNFTFESNLQNVRFNRDIELHLYRIISELVNNTIKHSGATDVLLHLKKSESEVMITYADNGEGYNVDKIDPRISGIGLQSMKNRMNLLQGTIEFINQLGKTMVIIHAPLLTA